MAAQRRQQARQRAADQRAQAEALRQERVQVRLQRLPRLASGGQPACNNGLRRSVRQAGYYS